MITKIDRDEILKILKDKCSKYSNIDPHNLSIDDEEILVSIIIIDGDNRYPFIANVKNYKYVTVNSLVRGVFKSLKEMMKCNNVKLINKGGK